jgi:hypothetical protein
MARDERYDSRTRSSDSTQITVQQLKQAAAITHERAIPIPGHIFHAFQSAVAYRRKVSKWFQSTEITANGIVSESTKKHVYFTNT